MNSRTRATALVLLVLLLLAAAVWLATGGGRGAPGTAQAPQQLSQPAGAQPPGAASATKPLTDEQRSEQLSEATFMNASEVEPLSVERLGAYLPKRLGGFERVSTSGARNVELGFPTTTATATYAGANGRTLDLAISDLSGPKGITAYAAWALLGDHDNSGDDGYERAHVVGNRRYYEQWDRTSGHGEQAVLLGGHFTVSVSGTGSEAKTLKAALEDVDLNGVEGLGKP
jgi:hypothetical protein